MEEKSETKVKYISLAAQQFKIFYQTVSIGSAPPANGDAMQWASSIKDTPMPVYIVTEPITFIISTKFLGKVLIYIVCKLYIYIFISFPGYMAIIKMEFWTKQLPSLQAGSPISYLTVCFGPGGFACATRGVVSLLHEPPLVSFTKIAGQCQCVFLSSFLSIHCFVPNSGVPIFLSNWTDY